LDTDDIWSTSPTANGFTQRSPLTQSEVLKSPTLPKNGLAISPELKPFLKHLELGVGILCVLITAIAIGGLFSEPIAMVATIIGVLAMVGLALAGRVWFVVIAFQESVILGVATIFVPLLWAYCLAKRIGRSQLAFALMVSALIPGVVTLCSVMIFTARHSPAGRSAARAAIYAKSADNMVKVIHEYESKNPSTGKPREVAYTCAIRIKDPARFISVGERGLSQFDGYVQGSLIVHEEGRRITFRYRGTDELRRRYRLYLSFETNVIISGIPVTTE
jgi:hypothetical protein